MGPNGSGKSTLAYSVAGHPKYKITEGTVTLDGEDVLAMSVDERARAGLFLAMQYPVEVPGVTVSNFLRTAKTAIDGEAPNLRHWIKDVKTAMDRPEDGPGLRRAQRQRGLLRRREEAPRDPPARAAAAADRHPGRDRLRPRRRRAQGELLLAGRWEQSLEQATHEAMERLAPIGVPIHDFPRLGALGGFAGGPERVIQQMAAAVARKSLGVP